MFPWANDQLHQTNTDLTFDRGPSCLFQMNNYATYMRYTLMTFQLQQETILTV
jgi:hypothetical protein